MDRGESEIQIVESQGEPSRVQLPTAPVADSSGLPREPGRRDRIVILGRRRAGKTIYLARLYERLWNSTGHLHMRALSGDTHKACMQAISEMQQGRWPASTLGAQYCDIEINYRGGKHLLVALDYPGEVFKKAFVENSETDDAKELLDHVDHAAAAIILLDAAVVESGELEESIDDDFGMVQAVHRIREWPGGEHVPIVMVFTKCDARKHLLRDSGGLRAFTVKNYKNLVRAMNRFKVFACAAVNARSNGSGVPVPNLDRQPIGVVEPLEYCLQQLTERAHTEQEETAKRDRIEAHRRQALEGHQDRRRSILFWSIFWSSALAVLGGIAIVTWILTHKADPF